MNTRSSQPGGQSATGAPNTPGSTTALEPSAAIIRRSLPATPPDAAFGGAAVGITDTTQQLDAFREIRTCLLAMAASKGLDQFTTLVAGTVPGSGASFIARNLAAAFALEESRFAILVDCDHRNPTQHTALGVTVQGGLFDYLDRRQASVGLLSTPVPNLHLIPAGHCVSHREYFSSRSMREVLEALRQPRFYLFLDGPPTKGSPDARILSDLADFVILVSSYGVDTAEGIAAATALFDPEKFAGVVFNEH